MSIQLQCMHWFHWTVSVTVNHCHNYSLDNITEATSTPKPRYMHVAHVPKCGTWLAWWRWNSFAWNLTGARAEAKHNIQTSHSVVSYIPIFIIICTELIIFLSLGVPLVPSGQQPELQNVKRRLLIACASTPGWTCRRMCNVWPQPIYNWSSVTSWTA